MRSYLQHNHEEHRSALRCFRMCKRAHILFNSKNVSVPSAKRASKIDDRAEENKTLTNLEWGGDSSLDSRFIYTENN